MIISASRRTDIPAFFASWFMERIRAGFCDTVNPFNPRQRVRVSLLPGDVEAIVFWSKNPRPLMPWLKELEQSGFNFCFHFTLTGYGPVLERNVPAPAESLKTFKELAEMVGPERITWRYDPVLITAATGVRYHRDQFARLAGELRGSSYRVAVSFFDDYRGALARLAHGGVQAEPAPAGAELAALAREMVFSARENGFAIYSCAEKLDLTPYGIYPGSCIDPLWLNRLFGLRLPGRKDQGQRPLCRCAPSKDIGRYGSCRHGCLYCYAGGNRL